MVDQWVSLIESPFGHFLPKGRGIQLTFFFENFLQNHQKRKFCFKIVMVPPYNFFTKKDVGGGITRSLQTHQKIRFFFKIVMVPPYNFFLQKNVRGEYYKIPPKSSKKQFFFFQNRNGPPFQFFSILPQKNS